MTEVTHGLSRKELVEKVYGDNPPPLPKKRRKKKYNATQAMVIWLEGMNKLYGGEK